MSEALTQIEALRTERLICAPLTPALIEPLRQYQLRNASHLAPWEPLRPEGFLDADAFRERCLKQLADVAGNLRFVVAESVEPDRIIASINYSSISPAPFLACSLGYSLDAAAQGNGYMREALAACNAWMFERRGLHRIMANYMPRNLRSAAVLKSLGFEIEGRARAYLQIAGVWEDHILTALINDSLPA